MIDMNAKDNEKAVKLKHPIKMFQITESWAEQYIQEYEEADNLDDKFRRIWEFFSNHYGVMYTKYFNQDDGYFSIWNHYGNETTVHIGDWIVPIGQDKYGHDLCFAMTNEKFEQYFTEDGVAVLD